MKYTFDSNSSLFSVQFLLFWNVASAREWDFTASNSSGGLEYLRISEGTLLTMQCKWTFTKRVILSILQRKCLILRERFVGSNSQVY